MNPRKRFLKIAKGQLKGELFLPFNLNYAWFMDETLERWRREGLPADADPREFFGLDRIAFTGGAPYSPIPPFEEEVLSDEGETRLVRDHLGIIKRVWKDHESSKMPQWLDFPIKSRGDFEAFKKRLDPRSPSRWPRDWARQKKEWEARDYPLGIGPGSFFGHTLQRWVGTENLCMLFYDDPRLVHEMLDYLEWFFLELVKGYVEHVDFDFASFGEDIAYKGHSFISPRLFREFFQPHYVRICEVLRSHGVEVIFVDSDGFIDELIPLWLEVGINGFSPLEVAAGEDALALKKRYGSNIVLAGNIDKRALIKGTAAIDREVTKARRLLALGGYFPAVDHSVPPDVPLDNFLYLLRSLRGA
jgi:uroporphyrinogen decarboxylase